MASIRDYIIDNSDLQKDIKRRDIESELARRIEFIAARKIQAWFRGIISRSHICVLHCSATTIQRHWRGFRARNSAASLLVEEVHGMWLRYYNEMAKRIQALWRGYWSRKNGVDLIKFNQWLQFVYNKNAQALEKMRRFREAELAFMRSVLESESMLWILFILFKLHHLLRTRCQSGILTRIDKTRFTVVEEMMRCLQYTLYQANRNRRRDVRDRKSNDKQTLLLEGTYFERCEREIKEFERTQGEGKASIFSGQHRDQDETMLKEVDRLRKELMSEKYSNRPRFSTTTKVPCSKDTRTRLAVGEYCPRTPKETFPAVRPPRDKSKELHGDFKLIIRPNELYDAINKMDCPFNMLQFKCPIHDLTYG